MLITSRTPKEASSRSLTGALIGLGGGLVEGLLVGLATGLATGLVNGLLNGLVGAPDVGLVMPLIWGLLGLGLILGPGLGMALGLRNGGGFVLLQKVAHRHLAKAGNLPPRPYDFLEWGIERQIFHRVGGGVRFRHSLIQQHLANTSVGELG